ncbi:helix-turn-helix transcriptional regulator [Myxococcus sp. K15C18031901]|uniref:winged helix-turn-helix transcriptional regulator n=1 Tax=Myxococcus dinghuensis TaxID=2906761 RepID=UPI0020A7B36B|nr:helix-turn-helix domain-containing protein [Myxococcus dinghuensis]MCP3102918.1 helix-turn-helix transcriptional regulator [Myxococcus dinghuensis]
MAKRASHDKAECPVARTVDIIGDEWSLLILRDAFDGLRRFGEFQKNLGLAKNILATRLRHLVAHGILEHAPASDGSAFHEYVLTDKGRDLFHVLVGLRQWGEHHCFQPGEPHSVLVDAQKGQPVRPLEVHAHDGRRLDATDAVVKKVSEQKPRAKR